MNTQSQEIAQETADKIGGRKIPRVNILGQRQYQDAVDGLLMRAADSMRLVDPVFADTVVKFGLAILGGDKDIDLTDRILSDEIIQLVPVCSDPRILTPDGCAEALALVAEAITLLVGIEGADAMTRLILKIYEYGEVQYFVSSGATDPCLWTKGWLQGLYSGLARLFYVYDTKNYPWMVYETESVTNAFATLIVRSMAWPHNYIIKDTLAHARISGPVGKEAWPVIKAIDVEQFLSFVWHHAKPFGRAYMSNERLTMPIQIVMIRELAAKYFLGFASLDDQIGILIHGRIEKDAGGYI